MKQKQSILYLYKDFLPIFAVFEGFYILIAYLALPIISTDSAPGFLRCFASVFPFPACLCALYTIANFRTHNRTLRQLGVTARQTVRAFYVLNALVLPLTALHIGIAALLCRLPKKAVDFWQMLAVPGESATYLGRDFYMFTVLKVLLNTGCLCALGLFLGIAFCKLGKFKRITLGICNLAALLYIGNFALHPYMSDFPYDWVYALLLADRSLFPLMSLMLTRGAVFALLLCGIRYMTADLPIFAQGKTHRKEQKELHAKKKKGVPTLCTAVVMTVACLGFQFTVLTSSFVTHLEDHSSVFAENIKYAPCKSAENLLKLQLHCVPPKYRLPVYDHLLRIYAYPGVEYTFSDPTKNEALYEACFALAEKVPESLEILNTPYASRLYVKTSLLTDKNGILHEVYFDCNLRSLYCITLYHNGKVQEAKETYTENYKNVTNYIAYRGFLLYLLETENIPKADKLWAKSQTYRLADDMEAHAKAYADAANAFERENPYSFSSLAGAEHISETYAYMLRELADGV